MKITHDKEADALYIRLLESDYQCWVVRLSDEVTLDLASGERLVGIEILGASRLFEHPDQPMVEPQDVLAQ